MKIGYSQILKVVNIQKEFWECVFYEGNYGFGLSQF